MKIYPPISHIRNRHSEHHPGEPALLSHNRQKGTYLMSCDNRAKENAN